MSSRANPQTPATQSRTIKQKIDTRTLTWSYRDGRCPKSAAAARTCVHPCVCRQVGMMERGVRQVSRGDRDRSIDRTASNAPHRPIERGRGLTDSTKETLPFAFGLIKAPKQSSGQQQPQERSATSTDVDCCAVWADGVGSV
jgi:hypothetical protein